MKNNTQLISAEFILFLCLFPSSYTRKKPLRYHNNLHLKMALASTPAIIPTPLTEPLMSLADFVLILIPHSRLPPTEG